MSSMLTKLPKLGWVAEFRAFILRGNVVDLAVGIIIGAAFTGIVRSLVKDIFTPVIGLLVGGIDFANIFITLEGAASADAGGGKAAGAVTMNVGVFLNEVLNFLIVAFVIFWLVKALTRLRIRNDAAPAAPTASELLLMEIRDLLKRNDRAG